MPAYLSNGMIGLRVRENPLHNGVAIINGYSGRDPGTQVEATPYAPYPLGGDISIGKTWLSSFPYGLRFVEQSYDFSCGELRSRFNFAAEGVTARVEVLTFCSRSLPTLALQEVDVEVDGESELTLRAAVDPTGIPGRMLERTIETPGSDRQIVDGALYWESLGGNSTCGVAYVTRLLGANHVRPAYARWREQGPLTTTYSFHAETGKRYRLYQIASMVPSELHHRPDFQAARMAWLGNDYGFDRLRRENREVWADLWRGRVRLQGAERRWQEMTDAAFYYLHASVHPSSPSSTAPFGLASWYNYHYYYGHIMWDLETFTYPPLALTYPDAGRALLEYRFDRLPAARSNAKMYGLRGAQYPWQSSSTKGEECTPLISPNSVYEQHTSLDVAYAFMQQAYVTGDEDFIRRRAWPILQAVAEWVASRVIETRRGYEIHHTTGPAEDRGPVDNNAYINMAAVVVVRGAIELARRVGCRPPEAWERIAKKLVIPRDPATNVILNYDGYTPDQPGGATPSAAAGFFPLSYRDTPEVEQATLRFYVDLADKYLGAPMLSTMYGVYAARLGDRSLSLDLFERGYAAFIQQPFNVPGETPDGQEPHAGPFFANLGGYLTALLFGLPGLCLGPGEPQTWAERQVVLPKGWSAIEVDRIWAHGRPARLVARHGDERARIEFTDGEAGE